MAKRLRAMTADERRAVPGLDPGAGRHRRGRRRDPRRPHGGPRPRDDHRARRVRPARGPAARRPRRAPGSTRSSTAPACASGACCSSRAPPRSTSRTRARSRVSRSSSSTAARAAGSTASAPRSASCCEYAALLHDIGTFLSYTRPPPAHLLPHPQRRPRRVRPGGDRDHGGDGATSTARPSPRPGYEAYAGLDGRSRKVVRRLGRVPAPGGVPRPRPRRRHRARRACAARPAACVLELQPAGDWHLEGGRSSDRRGQPREGASATRSA